MGNFLFARYALYIQSGNDACLNSNCSRFSLARSSMRTLIKLVDFDERIFNNYDIVCYTDGNKMNEKVGLAFALF